MSTLKISYYYSDEIGQPDLYRELNEKYAEIEVFIQKVTSQESEKFLDQGIKAIPFTQVSLKNNGDSSSTYHEVLKLYGDQSQIELETLIKEYM